MNMSDAPDQSRTPSDAMHRLRVVLVRPRVAGNIGAVARLMENFGAGGLFVVQPAANPLAREAVERSTRGQYRLHSARLVPDVTAALEGAVFAVGASRRRGPTHQVRDLAPGEMAKTVGEHLAHGEVALLFGAEDNGLSREELLACDAVVRIPASPHYPTLNLSHAVAICLYEIFLAAAQASHVDVEPPIPHREPADAALIHRLMVKLEHALLTIGYLRPEKPDHLMFPIRTLLSRARLSRAEAQILMGLAQQIDEFARYRR